MQSELLPEWVDCDKLVTQRSKLSGVLSTTQCARLIPMGLGPQGLRAFVEFGVDEFGRPWVRGEVSGDFQLRCERCHEPFAYALTSAWEVIPLKEGQSAWEDREAVFLDAAGQLSLLDLLEEECLLSLPMVPKHEVSVCSIHLDQNQDGDVLPEVKLSPFQVLKNVKFQSE